MSLWLWMLEIVSVVVVAESANDATAVAADVVVVEYYSTDFVLVVNFVHYSV